MILSDMNNENAKIILIRHAKVEIPRHIPLYAKEIGMFVERYKYAEIDKEKPSLRVNKMLNDSDKIFCSELRRSVDSLALLGKRADVEDRVFNEVEMPYPRFKWFKLYPDIWLILFRALWFLGYSTHSEPFKEAKVRAEKATKKLIDASTSNMTISLLGHGGMNRLIGKELVEQGWRKKSGLGIRNWSYVIFEKVK